ncbi:hypothetical protein [Streptomyces sp. NPDC003327]
MSADPYAVLQALLRAEAARSSRATDRAEPAPPASRTRSTAQEPDRDRPETSGH